VRTGDARLCKGVLAHCLPAICKAVILSLTRGFRALYVSALSCDFGGHVHRDPGNSQIDLMIAHVELIYSVSACLCSSRLYILLVKKIANLCYRIEMLHGESSFAPCLLLFVHSRTENAQNQASLSMESFLQRCYDSVLIRTLS
jgi:hypothetical protein